MSKTKKASMMEKKKRANLEVLGALGKVAHKAGDDRIHVPVNQSEIQQGTHTHTHTRTQRDRQTDRHRPEPVQDLKDG
jgi:hypothetical protein